MARVFARASSQRLVTVSAPVTAPPLTMAIWGNASSLTGDWVLLSLHADIIGYNHFALLGNASGRAGFQTAGGGIFAEAQASTMFSTGSWNHFLGTTSGPTSRLIWLNGVSVGTNTTYATTTVGRVSVGANASYHVGVWQAHFDGAVMWPAIWNVVLTDDEIASLAAGAYPATIRSDALVFFAPLGGFDGDHDIDIVGGLSLTPANSPTWSDDSPSGLIYPSVPIVGLGTAGGGGGFGAYLAAASRSSRTLCGSRL